MALQRFMHGDTRSLFSLLHIMHPERRRGKTPLQVSSQNLWCWSVAIACQCACPWPQGLA